jgi:hypothetical protein
MDGKKEIVGSFHQFRENPFKVSMSNSRDGAMSS